MFVVVPSLHFKSYLKSLTFRASSIVIFAIDTLTAISYPLNFVLSGTNVNTDLLACVSISAVLNGTPVFRFIYSL